MSFISTHASAYGVWKENEKGIYQLTPYDEEAEYTAEIFELDGVNLYQWYASVGALPQSQGTETTLEDAILAAELWLSWKTAHLFRDAGLRIMQVKRLPDLAECDRCQFKEMTFGEVFAHETSCESYIQHVCKHRKTCVYMIGRHDALNTET